MTKLNHFKYRNVVAALVVVLLISSGFVMGFKVAQEIKIEKADVQSAQKIMDLQLTDAEIEQLLPSLNRSLADVRELHEYSLDNATPPAILFNPNIGKTNFPTQKKIEWNLPKKVAMPANKNDLAFYTVAQLSTLIKNKQISSVELTEFFIDRLEKHGGTLEAVITITKERALVQAKRADDLLAKGTYLGPLHGIPYGAKDLLAVPGYKTTWGAAPYKDQDRGDELATVIKKLDDAGAVLVAKLTLGALAMGDVWYGGTTKNPWNLEQGASGSSAGSASATSAGLVPFALGTETLGSIVSPSTRNGVSGLRPTFGRVSKAGAMALSWSMDKIGPIARNLFDCALVFDVIRGEDGIDLSVQDAPFNYNGNVDLSKLRVGYLKSYFDNTRNETQKKNDQQVLDVLTKLGADLKPVEWVSDLPFGAMLNILSAEAAASFDELTRSNRDSLLVRQNTGAWPNTFREARFITAVDYINANRVRYEVMQKVNELMKDYDVIISPSSGNNQLSTTNLTGHPAVVMKNGYSQNGSPTSISFIGNLYDEATILAVARAYQEATGFDEEHPPMFVNK
ncbi:amidase [Roseivirga echinicomitans]